MPEEKSMTGALQGIRVLDFGRYIAGPYCAALLAERGVEVIRIEKRGEGREDRVQAPITRGGDGGLFMQMNRIKLGITLDTMKVENGGLKWCGAGSCRWAR
jgi:crotonobetainyl-CoA:carnitine CoA-transferase CaiB-like acyl-CoA transferase